MITREGYKMIEPKLIYKSYGDPENHKFGVSGNDWGMKEVPEDFVKKYKNLMEKYEENKENINNLIQTNKEILGELKTYFKEHLKEECPEYYI
jgi:hypothetical protein